MVEARPKVIAIIPAFNEENYIGTVVLKARQHADEVIVADDGSADQTARVARLAGATVIQHPRNRGYGASIKTLLSEVRKRDAQAVVLLDADTQHNPDEIPLLVKHIVAGHDLVVGSRRDQRHNVPGYRRAGQSVISFFLRFVSRKKMADTECGFRAFSPKAIATLDLREDGMAISAETIANAAEKGLKIIEQPVTIRYLADSSTMNPIIHGLSVLGRIIAMISERRPLFFFGLFGVIMLGAGVFAGIQVLQIAYSGKGVALGTALVSVLFLVVGVFSIFTGIILNALTRRK